MPLIKEAYDILEAEEFVHSHHEKATQVFVAHKKKGEDKESHKEMDLDPAKKA